MDISVSGHESDFVEDSKSESSLLAAASDNDESCVEGDAPSKQVQKTNIKLSNLIISSSEEEDYFESEAIKNKKSLIVLKTLSVELNEPNSVLNDSSSSEQIVIGEKKKQVHLLSSDDELSLSSNTCLQNKDIAICDNKYDSSIKNTDFSLDINSSFNVDNICSSTRFIDNSPPTNPNEIKTPELNIKVPTIDLTLPNHNYRSAKKNENSDLIEEVESGDESNIIVITDSEEESLQRKEVSKQQIDNVSQEFSSIQLSPPGVEEQSKQGSHSNSNYYTTRVDSLKLEETKLKMQVSEILRNIDTTKSTLKTAVLSALPDKGVKLQMFLKNQESKLRDLRYQQNTLSNEILKLQFASKSVPAKQQNFLPKMFTMPATNTNLEAMGKKELLKNVSWSKEVKVANRGDRLLNIACNAAMETHKTQQALTVDALKTLHNSLKNCPSEDSHVADPRDLLVELMPHQKHALAWLLWREKGKPSGGILADDMGLGKTLTMIALILKSYEEKGSGDESSDSEPEEDSKWLSSNQPKFRGKTLVVCPASLLGQWEGEVQKRLKRGTLDVLVHHGSSRESKARRIAKYDVVITTYNILSREPLEGPLYQVRWERVILDEAHQIRNHKTKTAESVFKLKARSRWALTGTPVHNKQLDLYALVKFLRCSPFDDLAVWKRWVDNRDAAGMQRLNTITKSLMLRRTKRGLQEKGELSSLKEKTFQTIFITLDEEEKSAYEKLLHFSATLFGQFLYQKAERENALTGVPVSSKPSHLLKNMENPFENYPELARLHKQIREMKDIRSHHILVLLLRLRQFCCHPSLVTTMFEKEDLSNVDIEDANGLDIDLMDKLTRLSLTNEETAIHNANSNNTDLSTGNPLFANNRLSSKMRKVLKTLEDILKSDDKVIVVSQWVSLLNLVYDTLKVQKVKCVKLTGQVPVKDRGEIVEKFNRKGHGPRVMLLSLTAGGVGLNLVGGNHLLLLDLHWNPQLESQACDRIYRVGQEKPVQIYKFVSAETIEERVLHLQERKLELANDVLTGAKHMSKLSLDDLKMLFQIGK